MDVSSQSNAEEKEESFLEEIDSIIDEAWVSRKQFPTDLIE